jgi:prolipoprotein diacylglyceryltransferase
VADVLMAARRYSTTPEKMLQMTSASQNKSLYLHPAQLYSSIDGFLLAILLNAYFYRRKRHGMVLALLLILYPIARIIEETVRVDNPHDTVFLTVSQFVSVVLLAIGVGMALYLRRLPLRSPLAVPFVSPWVKAAPAPVVASRKQK